MCGKSRRLHRYPRGALFSHLPQRDQYAPRTNSCPSCSQTSKLPLRVALYSLPRHSSVFFYNSRRRPARNREDAVRVAANARRACTVRKYERMRQLRAYGAALSTTRHSPRRAAAATAARHVNLRVAWVTAGSQHARSFVRVRECVRVHVRTYVRTWPPSCNLRRRGRGLRYPSLPETGRAR